MASFYDGILWMVMAVLAFTITPSCSEGIENIADIDLLARVARGEVQSCQGCQLNRLPDVKAFIFTDLQTYINSDNIKYKPIPGAIPELVLFDKGDEEISRIKLSSLNRKECNDLVQQWGFKHISEDTPDEDSSEESSREEL